MPSEGHETGRGGVGREVLGHCLGVTLALLLLVPVLRLDQADLAVPLGWGGDTFYYQVVVKGLVENGLVAANPSLGFPHGSSLCDTPIIFEPLHLALLRSLTGPCPEPFSLINLYFLAGFPLVALTSLVVLRHLGVSWPAALTCALLYAFAPYHLAKGEEHLCLSAYFLVPLAIMVALWACEGLEGHRGRLWVAALLCPAMVAGGPYYAFFLAFFLLVGGSYAALHGRRFRPLLVPLALVALIGASVVVVLVPVWSRYQDHGPSAIMQRNPSEAETFGLRIAQLVLPVPGHRVGTLADLRERYDQRKPSRETGSVSLGLVATCGFVILLGRTLAGRLRGEGEGRLLGQLALFNISGLLFATSGGLGALVALLLPQIRAYARMSIFLSFFAFLAVAVLLDQSTRRWSPAWRCLALGLLLAVGLLDQAPAGVEAGYPAIAKAHAGDVEWVARIEASLPPGSAVFQLPVMAFVGSEPIVRMQDYEPARGYLHSRRLRWSYGVVRGREGDRWQRQVAALPVDEMLDTLCLAGFRGLWLDRRGYADRGAQTESGVSRALGASPLVSADGRCSFFDLGKRERGLRARLSSREWAAREHLALRGTFANWGEGFYGLEEAPGRTWRWCSGQGVLTLDNTSEETRHLTMRLRWHTARASRVRLEGPLARTEMTVDEAGAMLSTRLVVPPGRHDVVFACDGPPVEAPGDSRRLVLCVEDFHLENASPNR